MSPRFWWATLATFLVGYGLLTFLAHRVVNSMLFLPDYASRRPPLALRRIALPQGGSLGAVYLPNPSASHTLWFFHGNAEDLGDLEPFLHLLHDQGFAVFAIDYPGYGVSSGKPSEAALNEATRIAADYLHRELGVRSDRVILYGRSLGSGPAVELATHEPVAGLVLQSAYVSVYRIMTRWPVLAFDKFTNLRKMPRVHCPVLVMHGTADEVIPFSHGRALYTAAPGPKSALWVEGAHHNDFTELAGPRYWQALRDFAAGLPERK